MENEKATVQVSTRMSPEEWVALRDLAKLEEKSIAVFIRSAINRVAVTRLKKAILNERY